MTIDGVKCDRGIIDASETAVKAKNDGRVSKEDAEKVFAKGLWRVEEVFIRSFMKTEKHFLGEVLWVCGFLGV